MSDLVSLGRDLCLAVTDAGDGPPVVLLHGWPVTAYHWRHTVRSLRRGRCCREAGHGRGVARLGWSRLVGTGPFDKRDRAWSAGPVLRLTRALAIHRVALVGHDWGGTIGYLLAADHPDRVWSLIVEEEMLPGIDVPIPEPGRGRHYPTWHGPFNRAPGLAEGLVPGREDIYYGTFLRQSAGPDPLTRDALEVSSPDLAKIGVQTRKALHVSRLAQAWPTPDRLYDGEGAIREWLAAKGSGSEQPRQSRRRTFRRA